MYLKFVGTTIKYLTFIQYVVIKILIYFATQYKFEYNA